MESDLFKRKGLLFIGLRYDACHLYFNEYESISFKGQLYFILLVLLTGIVSLAFATLCNGKHNVGINGRITIRLINKNLLQIK